MYRSYILSTLLLGASLAAPIALKAQDESRKETTTTTTTTTTETRRYYDPEEKVYRNWTADEDRAYRRYLTEQREYWRWRHGHPESVTVTTEKEKH
jgi:Ni/Co efflux regulator RcnB